MTERVSTADVQSTFIAFLAEADRNGIDIAGWTLVYETNPTRWSIQVRRSGLLAMSSSIPGQGTLGNSAREAQMRLRAIADGMRMVRFAREDKANG
jgi:hypothetical protein